MYIERRNEHRSFLLAAGTSPEMQCWQASAHRGTGIYSRMNVVSRLEDDRILNSLYGESPHVLFNRWDENSGREAVYGVIKEDHILAKNCSINVTIIAGILTLDDLLLPSDLITYQKVVHRGQQDDLHCSLVSIRLVLQHCSSSVTPAGLAGHKRPRGLAGGTPQSLDICQED